MFSRQWKENIQDAKDGSCPFRHPILKQLYSRRWVVFSVSCLALHVRPCCLVKYETPELLQLHSYLKESEQTGICAFCISSDTSYFKELWLQRTLWVLGNLWSITPQTESIKQLFAGYLWGHLYLIAINVHPISTSRNIIMWNLRIYIS